jgi:hypothetical protein
MISEKKFPFAKVFVDTKNQVHVITHTDETRHGHYIMRNIGAELIEFVTLDFADIRNGINELSDLIFADFRNRVFDLAECLDGKHSYLYFYLIGELNNIFTDILLANEEKKDKASETLRNMIRYQKCFDYAVNFCLDVDNLPQYTISEKFIGFAEAYPEFKNFVFKSALAITPTYKGRLDFDKVETINKKEHDTIETLRLAHTEHEGVSLVSYMIIESLQEMLYFEFTEVLKQGFRAKKCHLCDRYFILQNKHEAEYCDRIYKGTRTCKQFGAKKAFDERTAKDPYLLKYKQIYKR